MKKIYFFILHFLCISTLTFPALPVTQPRVTVWIHGTQPNKLFPAVDFIKEISSFQDFIPKLTYIPGLASIQEAPSDLYVQAIARSLSDANPELFPYEHFYQFGWDGDATVPIRRASGYQLYQALKNLVLKYAQEYGSIPIITLISHSHGGNVLLHMHEAYLLDKTEPTLLVDRAVLLACPIQTETIAHVTSPLFRSILNIYSENDMIQIIDPQWVQPFIGLDKKGFSTAWKAAMSRPWFSKRTIPQLPNIKNIQVSWCSGAPWDDCMAYMTKNQIKIFKAMSDTADFFSTKRGLSHIEIQLPFFLKHIPAIMHLADEHAQSTKTKIVLEGKVAFQIT